MHHETVVRMLIENKSALTNRSVFFYDNSLEKLESQLLIVTFTRDNLYIFIFMHDIFTSISKMKIKLLTSIQEKLRQLFQIF